LNQVPVHRVQKRRHEPEDDEGRLDDAMDRSPTPERVKKAAPKRARVSSLIGNSRDAKTAKESKPPTPSRGDENDIDVGVLLGKAQSQMIFE